jgi:hypothetical protein
MPIVSPIACDCDHRSVRRAPVPVLVSVEELAEVLATSLTVEAGDAQAIALSKA